VSLGMLSQRSSAPSVSCAAPPSSPLAYVSAGLPLLSEQAKPLPARRGFAAGRRIKRLQRPRGRARYDSPCDST
jgi:hypothetical protein